MIDFVVQLISVVNVADIGYMREMTAAAVKDSTGTLCAVHSLMSLKTLPM